MIQRKPNNRLGKEGAAEVKQHPWLRHFPWEKLLRKEIPAPFLPSVNINFINFKIFVRFSQKKTISMLNNKSA